MTFFLGRQIRYVVEIQSGDESKFRRSIRTVSEQFGLVPIMDPGVTSSDEKTESNKLVRIAVRFSSDCF